MQAIAYSSLGNLNVSDTETPTPAPGEVGVKTASCGLCHTDIDVLHGPATATPASLLISQA